MSGDGTAVDARWEWRAFGGDLGRAAEVLGAVPVDAVQESDEVYLLSPHGVDTVKVRDGLLDVKHLEDVDDHGLECWRPVLKMPFPLDAGVVESTLLTLEVPVPPLARGAYTLPELLEEVVRPHPGLLAVEVHKRRERRVFEGCQTEVTGLATPAGPARTVAIESDDPALVVSALLALGLGGEPNTSYPRGLRRLVGLGIRYAVVDVGTNSVKFHVAERGKDGRFTTVVDRADVTRLGEGVAATGRLAPAAAERTAGAIDRMAQEARRLGVDEIAAVGTAGLRRAADAAGFVAAVRDRCGVVVEVISGDEESRLAGLAVRAGLDLGPGPTVIFDTGGGSSQFTFARGDAVEERFSVDVGAVRLTERYGLDGAVREESVAAALAEIDAGLARLAGRPVPDALVGMGGAVTNLAAVRLALEPYDPDLVHGTVLEDVEVDRQIELYRTRSAEERRAITGLQPARAEVILAGACVVRTVLRKLGVSSLVVSDRGLRHGVLLERFGERARDGEGT